MSPTDTLETNLFPNRRSSEPGKARTSLRPSHSRISSFDPSMSEALPDVTFRDESWRAGDRGDLVSLAALAGGFATVALLLAYVTA